MDGKSNQTQRAHKVIGIFKAISHSGHIVYPVESKAHL